MNNKHIPIPPADVAELQRENAELKGAFRIIESAMRLVKEENAELTRKLAEQQAHTEKMRTVLLKAFQKITCYSGLEVCGDIEEVVNGIESAEELAKLLDEARKQEREEILNEHEWFSREGKWLADSIRAKGSRA